MADLIVIEYDDMHKAEEVRLRLQKVQRDYLVDLADAVVAVKDEKGKVKLNQIHNLTASGAVSGGVLGDTDRGHLPQSPAGNGSRRGGGCHRRRAYRRGNQR